MEQIETAYGSVCINRIGKGHPIIVVNGGPGLSYGYMEETFIKLSKIFDGIEFILFNQLGINCTTNKLDITADNSVLLFIELIKKLELQSYDIIAHSWGAYLIYSSLQKATLSNLPKKVILLNPIPFTKKGYDIVGGKLMERVPQNDLDKIIELININTLKSGSELMSIALPYYCGRKENLPTVNFEYNIDVYNHIADSLDNFDFTETIKKLSNKFTFILGETDYIKKDDFTVLSENCFYLKGGHFSFIDDFEGFIKTLQKIYS